MIRRPQPFLLQAARVTGNTMWPRPAVCSRDRWSRGHRTHTFSDHTAAASGIADAGYNPISFRTRSCKLVSGIGPIQLPNGRPVTSVPLNSVPSALMKYVSGTPVMR